MSMEVIKQLASTCSLNLVTYLRDLQPCEPTYKKGL